MEPFNNLCPRCKTSPMEEMELCQTCIATLRKNQYEAGESVRQLWEAKLIKDASDLEDFIKEQKLSKKRKKG